MGSESQIRLDSFRYKYDGGGLKAKERCAGQERHEVVATVVAQSRNKIKYVRK